jgi:hypothetical protein
MAHNSDGSLRGWSVDRFAKGPAYTLFPLPDGDLSALYETVRTLATRPSASLILGHPRTGLDINAKHEATRENFGDYPQFVFALDVDKVAVPVGLGGPDKLPELARHFVDMLGPEFEDVRAVVHATASTGCLGSNLGSLRILYLLKTPWPISHMKGWAIAKNKEWKAAGSPMKVDTNVYVPGKWLFTARPRFVTGRADPIRVLPDGMMDLYLNHLRRRHPRATPRNRADLLEELKRFTKRGVVSDRKRNKRRDSELVQFWLFPPLDDCRAAYDVVTGGAGAWNGDEPV